LCRQGDQVRAYGAGLLSSYGELEHCLSDKPEHRPFDPDKVTVQKYPITEYQPVYFVADSFKDATAKVRAFAASLKRPFSNRKYFTMLKAFVVIWPHCVMHLKSLVLLK
jgi:phenylalanine-4-hydroxylase